MHLAHQRFYINHNFVPYILILTVYDIFIRHYRYIDIQGHIHDIQRHIHDIQHHILDAQAQINDHQDYMQYAVVHSRIGRIQDIVPSSRKRRSFLESPPRIFLLLSLQHHCSLADFPPDFQSGDLFLSLSPFLKVVN